MEIIPAIYILDGRCVALYKGSYEQKATYMKSPIHMARFFENEGAQRLHIVDLNGRRSSQEIQMELLQHLLAEVKIPVQLEASFNSLPDINKAFSLGIFAIVLRPRAQNIIKDALQTFGAEKIIVEIQAKGNDVIFEVPNAQLPQKTPLQETDIVDFAESLVPFGVKNIIYKDEHSEGTMIHPNYDEVDRLVMVTGQDLNIYLSGGVGEIKHLLLLKKIGVRGAVIGKALYEGRFTLEEAIAAVQ